METKSYENLLKNIAKNDQLFLNITKKIKIYSSSTKIARNKKIINLDFNSLVKCMEKQRSNEINVEYLKNDNNFIYWILFSFNEIFIFDQINLNENKQFFKSKIPSFLFSYTSDQCQKLFIYMINDTNCINISLKMNKKELENNLKSLKCKIIDFLIKRSQIRTREMREKMNSSNTKTSNKFEIHDFVFLYDMTNIVNLCYNINDQHLYVLKSYKSECDNPNKLFEREVNFYRAIDNKSRFIAKLFGTIDKDTVKYIVLEYIEGETLRDFILNNKLDETDKIKIILEITFTVFYIHLKGFLLRDIKWDNIMIDYNCNAILIDFDLSKKNLNESERTSFIGSVLFISPEQYQYDQHSFESDVYSLGMIIHFIISQKSFEDLLTNSFLDKLHKQKRNIMEYNEFSALPQESRNFEKFKDIYMQCLHYSPKSRLPIDYFIISSLFHFTNIYQNNLDLITFLHIVLFLFFCLVKMEDQLKSMYLINYFGLEEILKVFDLNNMIECIQYFNMILTTKNFKHENQKSQNKCIVNKYEILHIINEILSFINFDRCNYCNKSSFSDRLCIIGNILYGYWFNSKDIKRAIHYYSLSAELNNSEAQYQLGIIYLDGKFIPRNINKSIHYFSMAANSNHSESQYVLGTIYSSGLYFSGNINKAIFYFQLAANQNHLEAQFSLGIIYLTKDYNVQDIDKAIQYLSIAADQNHSEAQYFLGVIYASGEVVQRDINKSINYLSLAANQNHLEAQFSLGIICFTKDYNVQDIDKAIQYLSIAANRNHSEAQYFLGVIYETGECTHQDIDKSIFYYSLAANQGYSAAQNDLGVLYLEAKYVKRDIQKAIHYFTLAVKQNNPNAQYNLGVIYMYWIYPKDIVKSLYYYSLSAKQNNSQAQTLLGFLYYNGEFVSKNINKAIYYFQLAANQNNSLAQLILGLHYLKFPHNKECIKKGFYYVSLSSLNRNVIGHFILGFLYHEGEVVEQDINKAIHYYKEASSFNHNYSKNNLGIIYKHGFGDVVSLKIGLSIEYFKEAISQRNDKVSMYNLAHLYFYDDTIKDNLNRSIDLLMKSAKLDFFPAKFLLCLSLIKKHKFNINNVREELDTVIDEPKDMAMEICQIIKCYQLEVEFIYWSYHEDFRTIDFLYANFDRIIQSDDINVQKNEKKQDPNKNIKKITKYFYEGFGIDI
ncbi:hypothetical protein M9Y10_027676 [Tritrichomonas musculus]|uniref:Protein kinase domain-containing protein n=1 Tax=Tritrichomonas musculus TaxID=1915356 RepID=A0ABR2GLM3_9EUKA